MESQTSSRVRRLRRTQFASLLLGGAMATAAVIQTSNAAFTATTEDGSNTFASGTVSLVDDDSGAVMFELSNLVPGDSNVHCIEVDYTGTNFSLNPVKLYGALDSNVDNFADHLDVTVEIGTGGSFADCTGFAADSTLVATTPLSTFATTYTDYSNGLVGYTPASGSTSRVYRFTVELGTDTPDTAQGDSAAATFTWEVQSA